MCVEKNESRGHSPSELPLSICFNAGYMEEDTEGERNETEKCVWPTDEIDYSVISTEVRLAVIRALRSLI